MRQPPRRSWPGKAAGIINSASSLGSRTAPRARPACGGAVSLKGGERKRKKKRKISPASATKAEQQCDRQSTHFDGEIRKLEGVTGTARKPVKYFGTAA
ncbi:hypothetical protein HPB51_011932 [Rhipicephalus microplus]|uniref:Uncharacterized protein n=1 Tax=Rhipicephalus microplus TaxID=6941 RepID=A0A9J6F231_RHIMP|nr:hypothetical protein HPB51_011932 [Rhipicephalus microplus]